MNNAQIQLATTQADGLLQVDVKIANAPEDFFGAAFDLVVEGGEWSLQKYEAGDFFAGLMNPPLMLAVERKDGGHRIVAGISLKRGMEIEADEGTLVSFFLDAPGGATADGSDGGNLKISFANNVLSVLKDGERTDVKNAEWKGAGKIGVPEVAGIKKSGIAGELDSSLQTNLYGTDAQAGFLWWDESIFKVYLVLGIALLVILSVLAGLFLAKKIKLG